MSLERRIAQMRQEGGNDSSPYSLIEHTLKRDSSDLHAFLQRSYRGRTDPAYRLWNPLDDELAEVYELRPIDNSDLSLPANLNFFDGFSYVAGHWYPLVRIVGSGIIAPGDEAFMDSHLERMFPDNTITTQILRDALAIDPSGATWLEERARAEFTEGTLALIGARKAIAGVRNMYEALTATS